MVFMLTKEMVLMLIVVLMFIKCNRVRDNPNTNPLTLTLTPLIMSDSHLGIDNVNHSPGVLTNRPNDLRRSQPL